MRALVLSLVAILTASPATAEPTILTVRVLSHDAKLIGDLSGGAWITVRNADTGAVLAEGPHFGGTGDTRRIIVDPQVRGADIYTTEGAAGFVAEVDLAAPTLLTVEARAPLGFPQSEARGSTTFLALPGHDIVGDGVILELYGLIVSLMAPAAETRLTAGDTVQVEAGVKLLCTCPIEPGGLWDADQYRVTAAWLAQDEVIATTPLTYAGRTSVFSGSVQVPAGHGVLQLRVTAANDERMNFGQDMAVFRVRQP